MMMEEFIAASIIVLIFLALLFGVATLFAVPVYFLWNWLMPALFLLPKITFVQSIGLGVLCSLLFKGASSVKTKN